ncbi:hypothetical protein SEPCBS119000_003079 [Sporothrix epigloea]|uniref:Vacuolar ATPase assembly protein VMA22 n=1 Tax=Sporothrix epigloea TaxID=1892477 RepID=A0ABP0DNC6_9PEZI
MASESIDELLARYLGLLHEYTELRSQLSTHQSSMFSHLARANFTAERGFRYGPDHFDSRMKALARLEIAENSRCAEKTASFAVVRITEKLRVEAGAAEMEGGNGDDTVDVGDNDGRKENVHDSEEFDEKEREKDVKKKKKQEPDGLRNPLQWFGVLTPMALRQAQQDAITTVDSILPRLASLDAEMMSVEIEVRRARKKRARDVAARVKKLESTIDTTKTEGKLLI